MQHLVILSGTTHQCKSWMYDERVGADDDGAQALSGVDPSCVIILHDYEQDELHYPFFITPASSPADGGFAIAPTEQLQTRQDAHVHLRRARVPLRNVSRGAGSVKPCFPAPGNPAIREALFAELGIRSRVEEAPLSQAIPRNLSLGLASIHGLHDLKDYINRRIVRPLAMPGATEHYNLPAVTGCLLYGPPGTGKTSVALAIARELGATLVSINPSVIAGMPGEAESKIQRLLLELATSTQTFVLLVDEAEALFARRDNQVSSYMQRIVPVLLSEITKLISSSSGAGVVCAVSNKPQLIDEAFLRPGRLDRVIYVGLPDQDTIRQMVQDWLPSSVIRLTDEDRAQLADTLERRRFSGADVRELINRLKYAACARCKVAHGHVVEWGTATRDDLDQHVATMAGSVSPSYEQQLTEWERGRRHRGP